MQLVGGLYIALHIIAEGAPLALIYSIRSSGIPPLLEGVHASAVDLCRLSVFARAGDHIDPSGGLEAVAHRCFDTDPSDVFRGFDGNCHVYIAVGRGVTSILSFLVLFERGQAKRHGVFVIKPISGVDLTDLFRFIIHSRIGVPKAHTRRLFIKALYTRRKIRRIRRLRIEPRIVCITVIVALFSILDDMGHR